MEFCPKAAGNEESFTQRSCFYFIRPNILLRILLYIALLTTATRIVAQPSFSQDSVKKDSITIVAPADLIQMEDRQSLPASYGNPVILPPGGDIDWNRFGVSTAVLGSAIGGIHILQYNSWWKDQRGPFHITEDYAYKANFDKLGHGFGSYYASHFFREAYSWSGFDEESAVLMGAASACLWEFYVEIEDGFAKGWGFSPSDAKADIAGALFYVARNRIPFLRNFQYKWTYFPSQDFLHDNADTHNPIDDYGGQYYWMVANINGLLPKSWQGIVPDWLGLTFGVGGDNLEAPTYEGRKLAFYIGLDYDMAKIIPESNIGILNFVRRALEYWHFPAPAFRLQPDPRFFILFPFRMSIG